LVKQLVDPSAQIRRISCWTLSRYAAWVFKEESGVGEEQLQEMVTGIMMRVLDRHKLVQEAACSALTSVQGHALERIVPYLSYFLRNLM
jgi:transportin-1